MEHSKFSIQCKKRYGIQNFWPSWLHSSFLLPRLSRIFPWFLKLIQVVLLAESDHKSCEGGHFTLYGLDLNNNCF
jgi:hypothetical protein